MTNLTQEELRRVLDYNPDTGAFTRNVDYGKYLSGSVAGGLSPNGYRRIGVGDCRYRAGRLAWFYIFGEWPKGHIDHVNGDRDDNRLSNLRDVSQAENNRNLKRYRNNASGVVGVNYVSGLRKWVATIKTSGKNTYLGCFDDKHDAIAARKVAERKLNYHPNHGR